MRLLLDTHVVLWSINNDARLRPALRRVILDPANKLYFSYASIWEISIRLARGRLTLPGNDVGSLLTLLQQTRVGLLPIHLDHLRAAAVLPFHHGDPFDRLIAAQAIAEDLRLVTEDPTLRLYDVDVLSL